ncbi:hypothetical protein BvCmsNSNP043_01924 [Escherichia coli]|nr:hypothetical protein BvCmsNSNP043_01924 [Escherichia coli]
MLFLKRMACIHGHPVVAHIQQETTPLHSAVTPLQQVLQLRLLVFPLWHPGRPVWLLGSVLKLAAIPVFLWGQFQMPGAIIVWLLEWEHLHQMMAMWL